ncbi:MAG: hypothetical protein KKA32_03020 [Actinobacteria bacterium]|nr:hypothetical protein [Actinomycetota bacterium]
MTESEPVLTASPDLESVRRDFIEGMSRVAAFWGLPKAMGAIYGALYLSPEPLSLDDLVAYVGVTKGAVSTNVRHLARLGMVREEVRLGERRDFYSAEGDFWKVVKGVLREREKAEFDRALSTVRQCLDAVGAADHAPEETSLALHYQERLGQMQGFFSSLDTLVATVMRLDDLRHASLLGLFGKRVVPAGDGNPREGSEER